MSHLSAPAIVLALVLSTACSSPTTRPLGSTPVATAVAVRQASGPGPQQNGTATRPPTAPQPTATTQPVATPVVQQTAWVSNTEGQGVYLRRTPMMADKLRAYPDGTELQVTGADVAGDGNRWRPVRAPDGSEGYIPVNYVAAARPAATVTVFTPPTVVVARAQPTLASSVNACNPPGLGCGEISRTTGLPRTNYVSGYTRRDGTYVRPYYRSHR